MATSKRTSKSGGRKAGSAKSAGAGRARGVAAEGGGAEGGGGDSGAGGIVAWENDPMSKNPTSLGGGDSPVPCGVPRPDQGPLAFDVRPGDGGPVPPAAVYAVGTREFRYWTAAEALSRGRDSWLAVFADVTPPVQVDWFTGPVLPVNLDDPGHAQFNAFYDRAGLSFFHDVAAGQAIFSGESPDVVCHEMGHAVLDAIRPELFDASFDEAAAFHEAFGDMSAMLSALQLDGFCNSVISETGGKLDRSSRLSRLAEQLGFGIREHHPMDVDPDCLRNASNSFFYEDPQTLAPGGPASALTSEPHSFSRLFSAAFLDALAGMFRQQPASGVADLRQAGHDLGCLLVEGVLNSPIVPEYYSQVAAHLLEADAAAPFDGKYRDVLKSAFVRRGILSLESAASITAMEAALPKPVRFGAAAGGARAHGGQGRRAAGGARGAWRRRSRRRSSGCRRCSPRSTGWGPRRSGRTSRWPPSGSPSRRRTWTAGPSSRRAASGPPAPSSKTCSAAAASTSASTATRAPNSFTPA